MRSVLPPGVAVTEFCKTIIDSVYDLVPAVKPQSAYFEQLGADGADVLYAVCEYAQSRGLYVILDAKRGDIGTTAVAYADAYLGGTYPADCITVNPYLGSDGIAPFADIAKAQEKSVFALVKTSNPSSKELQDLKSDNGEPIYLRVAEILNANYPTDSVGFVVGATQAAQLRELREKYPATFFLIPGYGAQGGTASDIAHARNNTGGGYIVNSSRGIIGAWQQSGTANYGNAAREAVIAMTKDLHP
jgi:orotidine-5'-phosphate decarboxylase